MRILIVHTGEYGLRHMDNVRRFAPPGWAVSEWRAPTQYPIVIDDPVDFLPASLPQCDLLASFAEHKGVAELLPDLARLTGAQAVLAPVDSEAWLPRGLARQLRGWLERQGVACVTPKPLCSLTEREYWQTRRLRVSYENTWIAEFARYFGRPAFELQVNPQDKTIAAVQVRRDAVCGCARFVAEGLVGLPAGDAAEKSGLLHHHFPCLASMGIDIDYDDTLMHVSGNLLKDHVAELVRPFAPPQYLRPNTGSDL